MVPPSGHLAGVYARSDAERGVHKAPANEVLRGALGVRYPVGKILQGTLNPFGVNCIRAVDGTVKVYGARTLASDPQGDPEWTYINVRRLVNFLRESIDQGTQWVVFEPNAPDLWSGSGATSAPSLTGVWATGALLGVTADQAFYAVRRDHQPAGNARPGPGGDRGRRRDRAARRIRRVPAEPVGRPGAVGG
jgi:phage tail sheath protein FI